MYIHTCVNLKINDQFLKIVVEASFLGTCVCEFVCVCIFIYIYIYKYIHIYTNIYMYIYTSRSMTIFLNLLVKRVSLNLLGRVLNLSGRNSQQSAPP